MKKRLRGLVKTLRTEHRRRGSLGSAEWVISRAWRRCMRFSGGRVDPPSELPIDVVIPCGERDLETLGLCIEGVQRFVRHPIERTIVVTNRVEEVEEVVSRYHGIEVVDETDWLGPLELPDGVRGGVLQQFLKIEARHHVSREDYLVVDADTVFLRPRVFHAEGRYILRYTDKYGRAFYRVLDRFLPEVRRFPVSFMVHHVLLNGPLLDEFVGWWEASCGKRWLDAAIDADREEACSLSEYELYGNGMLARHRSQVRIEHWHGVDVENVPVPESLEQAMALFPGKASASFHWFMRPQREPDSARRQELVASGEG